MKKERMNGEKQVMLSNWIKFWQIGQRQTSCATNIFSAKYSQNCDGEFELLWYTLRCAEQKIEICTIISEGVSLFYFTCFLMRYSFLIIRMRGQKYQKGNCSSFNSINISF